MNKSGITEEEQAILRKRLKERRLFLNYTYQDLADKTGMSKSTLQRYETGGIKNLSYDVIFKLSEALEVDPKYFTDLNSDFTATQTFKTSRSRAIERQEYLDQIKEFEISAINALTPTLFKDGYGFERKSRGSIGNIVATKGNETWHIDFMYLRDVNKYPTGIGMGRHQLLMRFGRLAVYNKPITKYSIVIDNLAIGNNLIKDMKPIHLNIGVSIIVLHKEGFTELKF